MPQPTFERQAPMMPKAPRAGGLRMAPPRVVPFGGASMSNEAARVAPPGITPATVHGAYGDTSVPNSGHEYHPAMPPVGRFNVPIGGVPGGTMHPPMPGYGQPVPHPPMPMPMGSGQYAPPSLPPTQMMPHPAEQQTVYHLPNGSTSNAPIPQNQGNIPLAKNNYVQQVPPMLQQMMTPGGVHVGGEFSQHAMTHPDQWTPHQHQQLLESGSANYQLGQANVAGRAAARNSLHNRTMGTYESMGQGPGYVPTQQQDMAIAQHQHQQMLNGLSASDQKQLQLGGAKPPEQFTMPPAPTLDASSRFAVPRGVNHNEQTGSTYFKNGNGTGILGQGAVDALAAKPFGIRPTDFDPRSPYNPQAKAALRQVAQASEKRLAEERSAAGGGVSKAAQYARAQSDQKILNRARQAGVGPESPAVSAAMTRETGRQEELRNGIAGLGGGTGNGTGLRKQIAAANKFGNSDVGKQFADAYQGEGRYHYDKGSSGILNHLNKKIDTMDRGELEGLSAWVENHPELSRESSPHANEIRAKIAAKLNRGKSKTATAPPAPSAPTPPMTVGGTNVGYVPDQL